MASAAGSQRSRSAATSANLERRRSLDDLNEEVRDLESRLGQVDQKGKVNTAKQALTELRELLVSSNWARAHGRLLLENASKPDDRGPTWTSVFDHVLFFLSSSKTLGKVEIDKFRLLLSKALDIDALPSESELKIFLYIVSELRDKSRTLARTDKLSSHSECVGIMLLLTSSRPLLLGRLKPSSRRGLLEDCISWIQGDSDPAEASSIRSSTSRDALIPAVLMVQYAQLLHQLVSTWSSDMNVLGSKDTEDGPFRWLTQLMAEVCEKEPPHFKKMANLLWSAVLQAILMKGHNALHEV